MPIDAQVRNLGQKYMGVRPQTHSDAVFQGIPVESKGNHLVPISNFMNAQCMWPDVEHLLHPQVDLLIVV
jgi:saccharopepsin